MEMVCSISSSIIDHSFITEINEFNAAHETQEHSHHKKDGLE
jgi:hypothetical protein